MLKTRDVFGWINSDVGIFFGVTYELLLYVAHH